MKGKTFLVFSALLIFFVSGCVSSAENTNKDFINIPDIDSYDLILVGEDHTNSENVDVELRLIKHYYALGIRDFAFEAGYGDAMFFHHYITTGDKECLEFIFKTNSDTAVSTNESLKFYRDLYKWNSRLKDKIRIHGFDVEHKPVMGVTAAWFFILKNYKQYKDVPLTTSQDRKKFIQDYQRGVQPYSDLTTEDLKLLKRIMQCIEQAELVYYDSGFNDAIREQCMTENLLEITLNSKNKKTFAITGAWHAALTGLVMGKPGMANALKSKIRVASLLLGPGDNPKLWPYNVLVNEEIKVTPYNSTYSGNWPFSTK